MKPINKEKYASIKVKESTRQKLKILAAQKGRTMAELLQELVEEKLK